MSLFSFYQNPKFFVYHGFALTFLWIVGVTLGIFFKKINGYLHGATMFIIDVLTIFFIVGAMVNMFPYFNEFWQWSLFQKIHILGGKNK